MEFSMGHGNFHGPWKFPWALEISRTWNFPWAMEISMENASITAMEISRTWKFPVAYLLGGLEVPSISEWFETITFKERSKGEHYRIQLKFVALRKLSLSIERLIIEHFWSQFKFVALWINTNKYHYGQQWPLPFKNLCAKKTSTGGGAGDHQLQLLREDTPNSSTRILQPWKPVGHLILWEANIPVCSNSFYLQKPSAIQ